MTPDEDKANESEDGAPVGTAIPGASPSPPAPPRAGLRVILARGLLLVASVPITLLAATALLLHPSAFGWGDPTLYAVPGASLLLCLLGFVASFAPFDRPQSTPRWTRPLVGFLFGGAFAGLLVFTSSFVVLAPILIGLALLLHFGARAVAVGPPDLEIPTTSLTPEELAELADPQFDWRVWVPTTIGAVCGLALIVLWRPIPGEIPVSLPSEGVAPVISRVFKPSALGRVVRHGRSIEVNGLDLRLHVSLDRPRILLRLRDQDLVIEPCLLIEEGSVDGFPVAWDLNGVRLEPGGPALVDFKEGRSRAWIRIAYPRGRARVGALAERTAFLGGRASATAISATIEIEVDLDWGRVVIDSRTRLYRSAAVKRATLGWIRLKEAPHLPCRVGLGEGIDYLPDEDPGPGESAPKEPLGVRFFSCDREQTRLLRAKRGRDGPYETLSVGAFQDWFVLPSQHTKTLIVAPDWRRLASRRPSRTAGFGLAENSFRIWRAGGGVNALFDVASGRYGAGFLPSALPAGLYRNRIVIHPLRREDPAQVAKEILATFALAEASSVRIEQDTSLTPSSDTVPVFRPEGPEILPPR
ncbi:MAG: hypothetical protein JKY65_30730 [Planctomycetes bacterium]|nr:hypothetical protein [Planctomycetota bacterium]